jgi:hypothetical protein
MPINKDNQTQANFDNDEISFKELILKFKEWSNYLKSKKKIILLSLFFGSIFGFAIAWFDKPLYKADLTFAMEEESGGGGSGISGALGIASSFGIDLGSAGGGAFAATNLAELMKSRLIIEKVLFEPITINGKTISLVEYYIEFNKLRNAWSKKPELINLTFPPNEQSSNFSRQQDSILKLIHKRLIDKDHLSILQKDRKVTILTIEVKNENELFAKVFCESLAKATSEFYIETKSKKAKINVSVLQKQVDSVKNELNNSITGVAKAVDNVYNLNPAFNIKVSTSKKKQVDVQANTSILTNLVVQLELAKISLRKETPLIQLIDRPIFPLEKISLDVFKSILVGSLFAGIISIIYIILVEVIKKQIN